VAALGSGKVQPLSRLTNISAVSRVDVKTRTFIPDSFKQIGCNYLVSRPVKPNREQRYQ
jgi:hypothetical protein